MLRLRGIVFEDLPYRVTRRGNRRMGQNTLFLAGAGVEKRWRMRRGNKSPGYTTEWGEVALARC